jgi:RNA polymerase sigma-70 factor (ECF subfamily)
MADGPSLTSATLLDWLHDPTNRVAWEIFAARYGERIRRWCLDRGVQEADAADVAQQLVTEIHARMKNFTYDPAKGRYRDWLRKVTSNACNDLLERHGRWGTLADLDSIPARTALELETDSQARADLLNAALAQVERLVSARDWGIFQGLVFSQPRRSGQEVAREFGMTVAATYMAKSRVLSCLKEAFHKLGGTDEEWDAR